MSAPEDAERRDKLLEKDWSEEWETLPEAPPLVPERLSLGRAPDVDDVVLTEAGEAKRFGDWTAQELLAALGRLRDEIGVRGGGKSEIRRRLPDA